MNTIPINTPADFECVADDLLTDFINAYSFENGCLGYVSYHDGVSYWSEKGERLYDRYMERLQKIGNRLFPDASLDIKSSLVQMWDDHTDELE